MRLIIEKPRNLIAKDLRSPKYKMRVVESIKIFNRAESKNKVRRELTYEHYRL
jgi:hypothetical protein